MCTSYAKKRFACSRKKPRPIFCLWSMTLCEIYDRKKKEKKMKKTSKKKSDKKSTLISFRPFFIGFSCFDVFSEKNSICRKTFFLSEIWFCRKTFTIPKFFFGGWDQIHFNSIFDFFWERRWRRRRESFLVKSGSQSSKKINRCCSQLLRRDWNWFLRGLGLWGLGLWRVGVSIEDILLPFQRKNVGWWVQPPKNSATPSLSHSFSPDCMHAHTHTLPLSWPHTHTRIWN